MRNDEIDKLWRGELQLESLLAQPFTLRHHLLWNDEQIQIIRDLVDELARIRLLRVRRQAQHRRSRIRR